jgi:hypothetical protein
MSSQQATTNQATGGAGIVRLLLIAAAIFAPIWLAFHYTPHHEGDSPFETLYLHVVPSTLDANAGHHGPDHVAAPVMVSLPFEVPLLKGRVSEARVEWSNQLPFTNLQLFQLAAVLLIFICLSGVPAYLRTGRGDYVTRLFAGFAQWIRDEMVYPVMGREQGAKLLPYFRDLRDNLARLEDTVAGYHERLLMAFDIYLNKAAFEANEGIKFLTALTAITIPVMVIGTWYGMNFEGMAELRRGYPAAVGLTLASTILMFIYLRKKRWF